MEQEKVERPEIVDEEHLEYLDALRESGVTNMYGASQYLVEDFPELSESNVRAVLTYWMQSFLERHPKEV